MSPVLNAKTRKNGLLLAVLIHYDESYIVFSYFKVLRNYDLKMLGYLQIKILIRSYCKNLK